VLSPLVRVDVLASHEAVEATQRRQRRQRGRRHLAGRWARSGGMTAEGAASEAARGHDRRSPPVESQGDGRMRTGTGPETTSWSSLITSTACRADSTDEARRSCSDRPKQPSPFATVEESQRVGFDAILSLTRLSASRRRCSHPDCR
jgi:hypothetical protein